jgi:parvulin-like peptidyl-prolyl isomerase
MMDIVNFQGAKAKVQRYRFKLTTIVLLTVAAMIALTAACGGSGATNTTTGEAPTGTAATVNGTAIKMEEVERVLKAQLQGQELSPLELAQARLQILDSLIQQEVMFQKAQKENTVPSDEEVTAELNKRMTGSGLSREEFDKRMKEAGETEATLRETIKKALAIQKLNDKITGKIEPIKDSEIASFYEGNKEQFKAKRGAQLGVIVIDPQKVAENDTTTNELEAQQKAKEVGQQVLQGADFATVAREKSEDPQTALRGGDWRYFTEDEMKQAFGAGVADFVMNKMQNGQIIPQAIPFEGRILIVKLQRKQERDEDQTLETPGVRQQIADFLVNARKQLLSQSYMTIAMNEAKIENNLAKQVVENPNNLSGARPASANTPAANTNTALANANANTNAAPANADANAANTRPAANSANANANARR